jgi:hypothetical protein
MLAKSAAMAAAKPVDQRELQDNTASSRENAAKNNKDAAEGEEAPLGESAKPRFETDNQSNKHPPE